MTDTYPLELSHVLEDGSFSKEQFGLIEFGLGRHGAPPEQIKYSIKQKDGVFHLVGECEVTAAQEEEAARARYERYSELAKDDPELSARLRESYKDVLLLKGEDDAG